MKKILLLAAIICLLLTPISASALHTQPSDLTVVMEYGALPLSGIQVSLCLVADAREENGAPVYDAVQDFAAADADFTDLNGEKNVVLAAKLDGFARANGIALRSGITDRSGEVRFSGLTAGLYLVAQTNSAQSEYLIAPYIVAVPNSMESRDGWNYNVVAYPKTEPVKKDEPTTASVTTTPGMPTNPTVPNYPTVPTYPVNPTDPARPARPPRTQDDSQIQSWLAALTASALGVILLLGAAWADRRKNAENR